jgi:hypothetical protein
MNENAQQIQTLLEKTILLARNGKCDEASTPGENRRHSLHFTRG